MQIKILLCLPLLLSPSLALAAGDAAKGEAKAATCTACHGKKGVSSNPLWPNLAGQKAQYLVKQIKAFKSGERKEPTMEPFVKSLTDEDIDNLAAYFSGLSCTGG